MLILNSVLNIHVIIEEKEFVVSHTVTMKKSITCLVYPVNNVSVK